MLEVRLLGQFDVRRDGASIAIPSRSAQTLFAYLILNAGTAHRREKLAGLLWPDSLEETARDNLRHALWRIRKALPSKPKTEYLLADDLSIAFNAASEYWLDATELEKLSENASSDELMAILSAYQGELLPGFYDEWAVLEREHLNSIFEHHMARLMSLLQDEKRWLDILDWGEHWIKLGQKPEPAYRALMTAHAAKGDMSKVAATYDRCMKSLKEFGVEPSEQTHALYERLKAGKETFETEPAVAVKEKRKASPKTNLPVPITSFVGREKEVEEVIRLLDKNRLVTLTGTGGVGKTRLAIEAGNKLVPKFKDGVWWVDLVGLSDPALVAHEVSKVVGAQEVPNQPMTETLLKHLHSKQILLVIDNCEHLISACAQLADRVVSVCKDLKILTTSREALDIIGETDLSVPPLSLPNVGEILTVATLTKFESVRLFGDRAALVQPAFELSDLNAKAVVQICHRLSGMPLAIELAAARVKLMSLNEIAKRLDDRFDLLTSGNRTALPRHQTLRATIDWSYDLLNEPERILFRRMAVFAGGFTLEAAEIVCGFGELKRSDVLDLLGRLVDKSLINVDMSSGSGWTRYRFLETIREYAIEKLEKSGEAATVRDQHLEFFTKMAEETESHLYAPEQVEWFARAEAEIDNMRAALDWSTTDMPDGSDVRIRRGLQMAGVLSWFWQKGYNAEFSERLKNMISSKNVGTQTIERARALNATGLLHWTIGNFIGARPFLMEALRIGRQYQDKLTLGETLAYLGFVCIAADDYDSARLYLDESIELTSDAGNVGNTVSGMAHIFIGDIYLVRRDESRAMEFYEEGVRRLRETYNVNMLAYGVRRLGYLAVRLGDCARAKTLFKESLMLNCQVGHQVGMAAAVAGLAKTALVEGKIEHAALLYGIVEGRISAIGIPLMVMDKAHFDVGVSTLRKQLESKTITKFWVKGKALTQEQAIEFVLKEA